jgi:hypothetical protein
MVPPVLIIAAELPIYTPPPGLGLLISTPGFEDQGGITALYRYPSSEDDASVQGKADGIARSVQEKRVMDTPRFSFLWMQFAKDELQYTTAYNKQ